MGAATVRASGAATLGRIGGGEAVSVSAQRVAASILTSDRAAVTVAADGIAAGRVGAAAGVSLVAAADDVVVDRIVAGADVAVRARGAVGANAIEARGPITIAAGGRAVLGHPRRRSAGGQRDGRGGSGRASRDRRRAVADRRGGRCAAGRGDERR
ncbi:hypothetical protein AB5I41_09520 [Sphingomonas sp. MMS24-JH45]